MKRLISFFIIILTVTVAKGQKTAQEIVNEAIDVAGGELYDKAIISFRFRDKEYISRRDNGLYSLERIDRTKDSDREIRDVVTNKGLVRTVDNCIINVADSLVARISDGVNSVHYFANLPYGLNDNAVIKEKVGEENIKGKDYYLIKVTFKKEGGGTDFEDEFLYWINKKEYTIDYLAYKYAVNGGGIRFREAYNPRVVNGLRFVDYNNYKENDLKTPLQSLGKLFETGKLTKVSVIELKDINVYINYGCC